MPSVIDAAVAGPGRGVVAGLGAVEVSVQASEGQTTRVTGGQTGLAIEGYRNIKPGDLRKRRADRSSETSYLVLLLSKICQRYSCPAVWFQDPRGGSVADKSGL
jgi:hypothetical protein